MQTAGVGALERDGMVAGFSAMLDSVPQRLTAAQICRIAAGMPAAEDTAERMAKDALRSYGFVRPVFDAAAGVPLDPKLVRAARDEEIGEVHKHQVWRRVPRSVPLARGMGRH